jgi:hypothetical protein
VRELKGVDVLQSAYFVEAGHQASEGNFSKALKKCVAEFLEQTADAPAPTMPAPEKAFIYTCSTVEDRVVHNLLEQVGALKVEITDLGAGQPGPVGGQAARR